jgi:integrase
MPLTDAKVRNARPQEKPYKLYDERGLFLLVAPEGGKLWRFRYRFDNKEKLLALGGYPDVSLKDARERRDEARKQLAADIDPCAQRKAMKTARVERESNSFEVIAREWHERQVPIWAPSHAVRVLSLMNRDLLPWLGGTAIENLRPRAILEALERICARGAVETAHRALTIVGQVNRFAIASGRLESDPARDLRGALPTVIDRHFPAITKPEELGPILKALWSYQGTLPVRCALRLAPLVPVRPGELRSAKWSEIDLAQAEWRFILSKTKQEHIVPLSRQAIEILLELHPATSPISEYVFPSARTPKRPMSDNAVLSALRRMDISRDTLVGHGFRASFRTIADEVLGFRVELIEHQLGHTVKDSLGRAYNRTTHLPARKAMMQVWSDYLDELRTAKPSEQAGTA